MPDNVDSMCTCVNINGGIGVCVVSVHGLMRTHRHSVICVGIDPNHLHMSKAGNS